MNGSLKLLSTPQAADLLNLSRRTLEAYRIRGGGPRYAVIGRRLVRYKESDLLDFVEAGVRANTSEAGAGAAR